jgi:hypothetical protein
LTPSGLPARFSHRLGEFHLVFPIRLIRDLSDLPTRSNKSRWRRNGIFSHSLTLAARNEVPRYRAATVRESVPLFSNTDNVFKGVTMGLRPTKGDESLGQKQ